MKECNRTFVGVKHEKIKKTTTLGVKRERYIRTVPGIKRERMRTLKFFLGVNHKFVMINKTLSYT